ncbi:hypothetical protein, partial [Gemmiger formicilis]|uniref:hypothetical protein n=1 Tax=Gemmiger formicilis TaxID=745368 RepID=UPI00195AC718
QDARIHLPQPEAALCCGIGLWMARAVPAAQEHPTFPTGRSHRIVACDDCKLQPAWMNQLAVRACTLLEQAGATA